MGRVWGPMVRSHEQAGDFTGAMKHFEAAKACFPRYSGPDGSYLNLARLKTGEEDLAGAVRQAGSPHPELASAGKKNASGQKT